MIHAALRPSLRRTATRRSRAPRVVPRGGPSTMPVPRFPELTPPELDSLKMIGNIKLAILTGQFTRDNSVEIDFLIVGNVNHNALDKFINELEKAENKSIRYSVMTVDEFNYRRTVHDRFVVSIINSKKQVIIDQDGILIIQENN